MEVPVGIPSLKEGSRFYGKDYKMLLRPFLGETYLFLFAIFRRIRPENRTYPEKMAKELTDQSTTLLLRM